MKLKVLQENLNNSLNNLQKAIPSRPQLPILSSILIESTKDGCTASATDLYFGVRSVIQVDSEIEGKVVVPGKQFKEIVSSLSPGVLTLESDEGSLNIISEKTKTTLSCQSSDEYPPFPQVEGEEFILSFDQLDKIEKNVSFSTSIDMARPVLTAILFKFSNNSLEAVGTDGFRLSVLKLANNKDNTEESSFLVPAKALSEVFRIMVKLEAKEIKLKISRKLKQIFFSINGVLIFVRLIDGNYPPYEKIIPSEVKTEVIIDSDELMDNLKRAMIFARESSNIVRLIVNENDMEIKSSSPSFGNYSGKIKNVKIKGAPGEIAFNIKYLMEYLSSTKENEHWFGMNESLRPAIFKPGKSSDHRYVIMPFKVNG